MTDDGMMTTPEQPDPLSTILAKLEETLDKVEELKTENAAIKAQNAQIVQTNARLMTQAPYTAPEPEPVLDVREVAYESFKKQLLRGKE